MPITNRSKIKIDPSWRPVGNSSLLPLRIGTSGLASADPAIQAVVEETLARFKYAFAAAAVDAPVARPSRVDTVFRQFLAQRTPAARRAYAAKAKAALEAAPEGRARTFGRFASVDLERYASAGFDGLASLAGSGSSAPKGQIVLRPPDHHGPKLDPNAMKQAMDLHNDSRYKKLGLFLKEVHCFEETSGPGSDEIVVGGVFTEPDGTSHLVDAFTVSTDFDEGESVLYPEADLGTDFQAILNDPHFIANRFAEAYAKPGRKCAEWTLRADLGWPTAYPAVVVVGEKDEGGFGHYLRQLLKEIVEAVEKELKMAIGTAIGTAIGAALGGVWGAVVGAAVGFVVGALIDWLTHEDADDIVGQSPLLLTLGAATLSYYEWTGLLKKPHPDIFPIDFKGDGGFYRLWFYLHIYE